MSRWIDIDDISLLKTVSVGGLSAKALWKRIRQQPSIDLVRCGECRYYRDFDGCFFSTDGVDENDYCSHGERRTDD